MTEAVALAVLQPHDVFACEHYRCKLTARVCVLRQKRAIKSAYGVTMTDSSQRASSFCKTGQCEQGRAIREQLDGVDLEPPRAPSVFLKPKSVDPIPEAEKVESGPSCTSGERPTGGGEDGRRRGGDPPIQLHAVHAPPQGVHRAVLEGVVHLEIQWTLSAPRSERSSPGGSAPRSRRLSRSRSWRSSA